MTTPNQAKLDEAKLEQIALTYLRNLRWQTAYSPGISPDSDDPQRDTYTDIILADHLRSKLRVAVKRVLRSHGYPPDQQDQASLIVLEQAEALTESLLAAA